MPTVIDISQNASRALRDTRPVSVGAVERVGQIEVELRPVSQHTVTKLIEWLDRQPLGVGVGLEHQRRDGTQQDHLGHPCGAVAADIARDFPTAGGVPDQDDIVQVESLDHGGEVVGVVIEVVAVPRLARPAAARRS
jgi:hypothetical protein